MRLSIHPSARERFDELATKLLRHVVPWEAPESDPADFEPEIEPVARINDENATIRFRGSSTGPLHDKIVGRRFAADAVVHELSEDGAKELESLVQRLSDQKALRNTITWQAIYDCASDWIEECVAHGQRVGFSDSILAGLEQKMELRQVWVPIANLHIESELQFGEVKFRSISKAAMDDWLSSAIEKAPEDKREAIAQHHEKLRQRFQGRAAAVMEILAEPARTMDKALAEADRAVSLLRLFCPENSEPLAVSYCRPLGHEHVTSITAFEFEQGRWTKLRQESRPPFPVAWNLSDDLVSKLFDLGLSPLIELATTDDPTEFEQSLLDSLLLYSKSSIAQSVAEKLVFMLVALESLLLRNSSEPIQQNVGERIAFIVGKDKEERVEIVKLFRQCYDIRSRFIHHGETPEDVSSLRTFMIHVWSLFNGLVKNRERFKKRDDLFGFLDDLKFS